MLKNSRSQLGRGLAGQSTERYNLQINGSEIINLDIARKYSLNSALIYPLQADDILLGYIFHISIRREKFEADEKRLLDLLTHHATVTLESCDRHYAFRQSLSVFSKLSTAPSDFIQILPQKACELFDVPIAILWKKENEKNSFSIVATAGDVDEEYRKTKLVIGTSRIKTLFNSSDAFYLPDIKQKPDQMTNSDEVLKRGWVSLLSAPLRVEDDLIGILNVFTKNPRQFKGWERELFKTFANHAALSFQKAELRIDAENNLKDREKLQKLTNVMFQMTTSTNENNLLSLLLEGALELVGPANVNISRLNYETKEFIISHSNKDPDQPTFIKLENSITGKAHVSEKQFLLKTSKILTVNQEMII